MWRETIARSGRLKQYAGSLLTGPLAFLLAGTIDVVLALPLAAAHLRRTRRRRAG
jgi:hypothetical protein